MPTSPARRAATSKNGIRATPSREAPSLEASLIATVAPVMRHLVAHARRRRAWSELTYQQYNVLRMIDTMGPQAQAEVARRLMVTAPVVTRLASALVDAELVEHRAEPAHVEVARIIQPGALRHAVAPAFVHRLTGRKAGFLQDGRCDAFARRIETAADAVQRGGCNGKNRHAEL